jgi:hypothetical protein
VARPGIWNPRSLGLGSKTLVSASVVKHEFTKFTKFKVVSLTRCDGGHR